jgi:hypothetical protein
MNFVETTGLKTLRIFSPGVSELESKEEEGSGTGS